MVRPPLSPIALVPIADIPCPDADIPIGRVFAAIGEKTGGIGEWTTREGSLTSRFRLMQPGTSDFLQTYLLVVQAWWVRKQVRIVLGAVIDMIE